MRTVRALAATGISVALVLAGTAATAAGPVTPQRDTALTVNIPVRTVNTPNGNGLNGTMLMKVGDSAPIRVIVDTGFSGLVLFPGAWQRTPAGVILSSETERVSLPNGSRVRGTRGFATMGFSGITTTEAIPFVYSNSSSRYFNAWAKRGVYGLLGIGTKGGGSMVNPLTALPGTVSKHWSIHFDRRGTSGALVLGAQAPTNATMTFSLPPNGENSVGAQLWDDQAATGCWTFAEGEERCVDTWFDAAFTKMRVIGSDFADLRTNRKGLLRVGTPVALAAPGAAFYGDSFIAKRQASNNLVKVIPRGDSLINTGNSFYFDYTLTYDLVTGRISVGDPVRKAA